MWQQYVDASELAGLYFAYSIIHDSAHHPFTVHQQSTLFNASRYLVMAVRAPFRGGVTLGRPAVNMQYCSGGVVTLRPPYLSVLEPVRQCNLFSSLSCYILTRKPFSLFILLRSAIRCLAIAIWL